MGHSDHDTEADLRDEPRDTVERLQLELDDLRDANEVLRATHATFHAVMELTDASVFAKDLDGRYLLVNPRGAEIVGFTPGDIIGHTDAELYDAAQVERFQTHVDEVVATRGPVTIQMPITSPEGTKTWMSHLVPLVDTAGEIYGVAGIATDVTERARQEALLRQRTRQLEAAQRIAKLGTWSWHPDTGSIEVSDELTRILGGSPGQRWTIGDLEQITHPDDLADAARAVRAARHGDDIDHVFRLGRPDGPVRWLRLRCDSLATDASNREDDLVHDDWADRDTGDRVVIGTIQDVTEREEAEHRRAELERRLQQSQRLETVGQLAGGVAHDFNNLLAVIGMQAELAIGSLATAGHDAEELLHDLQDTVHRASALTRQLLVFSRHEGYDDSVIDLRTSLEGLRPLLTRSLGTHIELVVHLDEDLHPVEGDRSQIEQVLVNLAMNSRDAMPDGGTLTIAACNADSDDIRQVRLTVSDTGTGMPPEHVERAFEPFFTTKPAGVGTGLGLPTVHGIVTRSGGTVELRSELGHGVTVEIFLPAATASDASDQPVPTHDDREVAPGDRTVLIVEDLEPLGQLAATVLERAGYRTLLATQGHEALELVERSGKIDLLLTDIVMPGMSGRELADRLRQDLPGLPVIFMTGYTGGMLELGDHDEAVVISKPFSTRELVDTVAAQFTPH